MQNFNKKDRVPNTIIGALLKHHYPQIVYDTTERPPKYVAATKWRHWCMKGPQDNTCADRVRSDFLVSFMSSELVFLLSVYHINHQI